MNLKIFSLFFFPLCILAQNKHNGWVLDSDDQSPLEFVGVYNNTNRTFTNSDGQFLFSSLSDSIFFYRPGYEKYRTSFTNLKDTIYLHKSIFDLDEVTVTNEKTLWQKVRDSLKSNYALYPHNEKFFLRAILRYNGEITRIQDMEGKLRRKTLLYTQDIEPDKKDYAVELTNMRKVGLVRDENDVYFRFDNFRELFMNLIPINASGEDFELTETTFENGDKIKLNFKLLPSIVNLNTQGHYIINTKNNAIERLIISQEFINSPYEESRNTRYRTIAVAKEISLSQSPKNRKYYIASSKYNVKVEITDEQKSYTSYYDASFIMTTSNNFSDFEIKKNVSTSKDIFKIKYSYSPDFWNKQNQLLLTDEMLSFIEKVQDPFNEFKINSNIK